MMHPKVRELYKQILLVGRDYPSGLSHVRVEAKRWFLHPSNVALSDEKSIHAAVMRGRRRVKEMMDVIQFSKYRAMKRRYETEVEENAVNVRSDVKEKEKEKGSESSAA